MKKYLLYLAIAAMAFAACSKELDPEEEKPQGVACVKIGEETLTMGEALERVKTATGSISLTMVKDYSSSEEINVYNRSGAVIRLDLNGKSIKTARIVSTADSLFIFDSSVSGSGSIISSDANALKLTRSYVDFSSGNLSANNCAFSLDSRSTVLITGGCFYVEGKCLAFNSTMVTGGKAIIRGGHFSFHPILDTDANSTYYISLPQNYVMKYDKEYLSLPDQRCTLEAVEADITIGVSYWGGSTTNTWKTYRKAIEAAGAVALNFEDYASTSEQAQGYIKSVDALIIPGSSSGDIDNRGSYEARLITQCVNQKKPILGICYGHQRVNLYFGGNHPSVESMVPESTVKHRINEGSTNVGVRTEAHSITIDTTSRLYRLLGNREKVMVNTSHSYALNKIGTGLKVVARADDGIVEAIESTDGRGMITGVQFHPEAMYVYVGKPEFLAIFEELIRTARSCKGVL